MIRARKKDVTSYHFSHYAPDRPKVDVLFISHAKDNLKKGQKWFIDHNDWTRWCLGDEQWTSSIIGHRPLYLGCTVISCDDVGCHHEVCSGRPRQTEIQDFQCTIGLDDDITRLQILSGRNQQKGIKTRDSREIIHLNLNYRFVTLWMMPAKWRCLIPQSIW